MAIPYYDEYHVIIVMNSLNNSSPGWNNKPALIAQRVIHCCIKPLVFLINKTLIKSVFPDQQKSAKLIPVYKSESSMELSI